MPPFVPVQSIESASVPVLETRRALWSGRLLVFFGLILAAFTLRLAVTSFTPLLSDIGNDIGFGPVMGGVFGMAAPAMFALAGITAPSIMVRIGLERTALLSVTLSTIGLATRSTMSDVSSMLLFTGVALFGMGLGNIVLPPLAKRYFSDRIALMSTIYISFVQLGTVVPALLAIPVADAAGWRLSLGMWALVTFAAILPWVGLARSARRNNVTVHDTKGACGPLWRSPIAWGLAMMFGMTSLFTYAFLTWLPTLLMDAGIARATAGTMLGVFILSGLASVMVVPTITTRMNNPFALAAASMIAMVAGMVGLLLFPMTGTIAWVILLGLGPSTFPMALTLINLRTRTSSGAAKLSGFTQGVGYSVACMGPFGFGLLHEMSDGWALPLGMLGVAVVVLITGAYHACKPRVIEDTLSPQVATG
ncbi:MFS transporter [Hoyosella rhizosphaerae]|uniref:MFS transporter n=1 Tax=Hoyosella rhizosphaerae TaxID=1755582 RepID=A0A916XES7_9ACTN|nr:MFS transporter [Hoyosella rhizosphaerae]MBN4925966.1 MFS transporter [Hoyosella rhizosphaerae]GGC66581.1 putative MFS transporter [Hoyosella rhizosphaerae]